ncbi:choline O-acetyltransferase [Bombus impatiens]|uniref:Choline O-acetyltransferase n=1 Tax=Bombus impatiens TaxID=132113 RepID=A0A6P8M271_BOMIM|nr:choline O-acetyltransferase [Bombus impatiens]
MCQGDPESQTTNQQSNTLDDGTKRVQFTIYSQERIKELFDLAVQRQTKEMNDNINGYGIDNHLMGLRYAAQEAGEPIPDIFTDQAYKIVNHFALSTSQVTSKNDAIIGYGPVVPDGYGCAYNLRSNAIIFSVSAFHSDGRTNATRFAQTLKQSLWDMADMLNRANQR